MQKRTVAFAVLAVCALASSPCFAWGPEGHRIIAAVAEHNLNRTAKAAIKRLLGSDASLANIANYADSPYRVEHPETGKWHFVNIPLTAGSYDPTRDCKPDPQKGDCVIAALEREQAILGDLKRHDAERLLALRLVVHFVGDQHQPLHAGDNGDRGGNDLRVRWFGRPTNLHAVWDSGIIKETGLSENGYAGQLNATLRSRDLAPLIGGTFADWTVEAHDLARDVAYGKLPKQNADGTVELGDAYYQAAAPIADMQLMRAGARLAAVLNGTLGKRSAK